MGITKQKLIRYYSSQYDDERRMYKGDRFRSYVQSLRLQEIDSIATKYLPSSADARVLDIGSGDGYATNYMLRKYTRPSCVGIDLSAAKLKVMRARMERCLPIVSDAECIPLKSGVFNIIFCFEVLEHVMEPLSVLKEIRRLLRSNGRCLISTPADSSLQPGLIGTLSRIKHRNKRSNKFNEHLHYMSMTKLRPLLEKARLEVVAQKLAGFQYPFRSVAAGMMHNEKLTSFEQFLSDRFRFGSFGAGPLTFGNEYLILCARPL